MWTCVHVYVRAPSSTPHHYFKMLPSQSDRPESDICVSHSSAHTAKSNTHARACNPTADHSLTPTRVYSIITIHQSLWTWPCPTVEGGGLCYYLTAPPRLPTGPSLHVSPFCCNAKLCEGKSTSISHAFLLRRGVGALEESALLRSDEQGICTVTLSKETSSWALSRAHSRHLSIGVCRGMHSGRTDAN